MEGAEKSDGGTKGGGTKVLEGMMEEFRREQEERDGRWQEEKRSLMERIERLEKRVVELIEEGNERVIERNGSLEEKLKRLEKGMEVRERKERRRNVVVRELEVREGKRREAVEGLFKEIGTEIMIEEVNKVGGIHGKEIWQVISGNEDQKREARTEKQL